MTKVSARGLIDIMSHEGLCLEPYLDSVGVWTIGLGQTKSDDIDPKLMGKITIQQAIDLFRRKIKQYTDAVDALKLDLTQYQYDALTSLCYNFGPGNLRKLCNNRSILQIGDAIMLYTKPPEITARRKKEQRLFQTGIYANNTGKVLVFPVSNTHHPLYKAGYELDVRPYMGITVPLVPPMPKPKPALVTPNAAGGAVVASTVVVTVGMQQGWGATGWLIAGAAALGALVAFLILYKK